MNKTLSNTPGAVVVAVVVHTIYRGGGVTCHVCLYTSTGIGPSRSGVTEEVKRCAFSAAY